MSNYVNKDTLREAQQRRLLWSEIRGQIQRGVLVTVRVNFDDGCEMAIVSTKTTFGYDVPAHELTDDALFRLRNVREFVERYNAGLYVTADEIGRIWWQATEPGEAVCVSPPSAPTADDTGGVMPIADIIDDEVLPL